MDTGCTQNVPEPLRRWIWCLSDTHWALCFVSMWQLLSQRVKSLFQAIHTREGSIPYNLAAFHGTYLCCVFAH